MRHGKNQIKIRGRLTKKGSEIMKSYSIKLLPSILLLIVSCNSNGMAADEKPQYTHLKDCKEQIENDNAAFSELLCPKIGSYSILIKLQSPQFITISLNSTSRSLATDFNPITKELPIEHGKVIEWHLENKEPKYMIFRLAWGTASEPFVMTERLVINLVTSDRICPMATINTKAVKNANQMARDLLASELSKITSCPKSAAEYPQ